MKLWTIKLVTGLALFGASWALNAMGMWFIAGLFASCGVLAITPYIGASL